MTEFPPGIPPPQFESTFAHFLYKLPRWVSFSLHGFRQNAKNDLNQPFCLFVLKLDLKVKF